MKCYFLSSNLALQSCCFFWISLILNKVVMMNNLLKIASKMNIFRELTSRTSNELTEDKQDKNNKNSS